MIFRNSGGAQTFDRRTDHIIDTKDKENVCMRTAGRFHLAAFVGKIIERSNTEIFQTFLRCTHLISMLKCRRGRTIIKKKSHKKTICGT